MICNRMSKCHVNLIISLKIHISWTFFQLPFLLNLWYIENPQNILFFSKRLSSDTSIQVVPHLSLKWNSHLTVIHTEEHPKCIRKRISGLLVLQTPLKFDSFQENTFYYHYRLKWIFIIPLRKGVSFLQVPVFVTLK